MLFKNEDGRKVHIGYYLIKVDMKNCIDQQVKSHMKKEENIQKIAAGQRGHYTTGCLLIYNYFSKHYKMIVINEGATMFFLSIK